MTNCELAPGTVDQWTLDLLFRKDVCVVHDLSSRANFHPHEWNPSWKGREGSPGVLLSASEVLSELK
jgi:hypothetical protein